MNHVDNPFESPVVLSLCPGLLRGLERGIESALGTTLRVASFVEIEAVILENLLAGMEAGVVDAAPMWANLKTFPYQEFHGRIHGFIGGYPCQPFSVAGQRKGTEDPRHLWPYIANGIRAVRPVWCFFENVIGHLTLGFEEVKAELELMGYEVEAGIYSAEEVGAPHRRERLFILAIDLEYAQSVEARLHLQQWRSRQKKSYTERTGKDMVHSSGERLQGVGIDGQSRQSELSVSNQGGSDRRTGPEYLGNSESDEQRREWSGESDEGKEVGRSSDEVANTMLEQDERNNERGFLDQSSRSGSKMADSNDQGLQGRDGGELQKCAGKCTARPSSAFKTFPSRPGEEQYPWEEPRTSGYINRLPNSIRKLWRESRKNFAKMLGEEIWNETNRSIEAHFEPPVGTSVNGYLFREDLLRGAGNGVVWQTAELAFRDLMRKHAEKVN